MEAYFDAMFETYDLLQNVMLTRVYFCFQDGSEKSDSKLPHGVTATFVRFVRELIGRADGFVLCIALLVAALAVSYTGICKERQHTSKTAPSQTDSVPPVKKKLP